MPAWLSAILLKIVLPDLIDWARRKGYVNLAEEWAAKGAIGLAKEVKDIKVDYTYPLGPGEITGGSYNVSNVNYEKHD